MPIDLPYKSTQGTTATLTGKINGIAGTATYAKAQVVTFPEEQDTDIEIEHLGIPEGEAAEVLPGDIKKFSALTIRVAAGDEVTDVTEAVITVPKVGKILTYEIIGTTIKKLSDAAPNSAWTAEYTMKIKKLPTITNVS